MSHTKVARAEVNGWLVLDKPTGMTSTRAVSHLKRILNAKKAGHAGTLDPLASGVLPVAFGEATKTVPFVQDAEKSYRFTVRWGLETNTDDRDGEIVAKSGSRPSPATIEAILPRFIGTVEQKPPAFSAIKISGERAYDLARAGEKFELKPRAVKIHALSMLTSDGDTATFETRCSKGTYVRSIARDLGRMLECYGHVAALRRTRVGSFHEGSASALTEFKTQTMTAEALRPIAAGLDAVTSILVDRADASRLRRGQSILLRTPEVQIDGPAYAVCTGVVIAIGAVDRGALVPSRVFNLPF